MPLKPTTGSKTDQNISLGDIFEKLEKLTDIKVQLDRLESSNKEILQKLQTAETNLKLQTERIDTLENTQKSLQRELEAAMKQNNQLQAENTYLNKEVEQLQSYSRINNLELHGIPEKESESVQYIVVSVARALNVKITSKDIDAAHRIKTSKIELPAPIVVKFVSRQTKGDILRAYRKNRSFTTKEIDSSLAERNIYINEHLTRQGKIKLKGERDLRRLGIKYVRTQDCKILAREDSGTPIKRIQLLPI